MMPSFLSLVILMIAVMLLGKARKKPAGFFMMIVIAALIQTAITFYDLYTMEIPKP